MLDRPGDLGGSDPREDAESCQHSGSTPKSFHLRRAPGGRTRLVIRKRGRGPRAVTWPVNLLYDPVHFIMQTRQFHGLRTRVGAQV